MQRFTFAIYIAFGTLAAIAAVAGLAFLIGGMWIVGIVLLVAAAIVYLMSRSIGNPYAAKRE